MTIVRNVIEYLQILYDFPASQAAVIMAVTAFLYFLGCAAVPGLKKKMTKAGAVSGLLLSFYISQVIGITILNRNMTEEARYDLNLMDIEMETMNAGILATQEIREADPEAGIIFLTAHETREMIVTAMGAGALDYIVKGCEDEEILYHIRCALKGNPIMSNKIHETVMQEYARLQQSEKSLLFFINNISKLTATEREMIKLLLQGYKVHEIAEARSVEVSTIKTQIKGLLRKFGCSRTKEIVQIIRELNIEHLF